MGSHLMNSGGLNGARSLSCDTDAAACRLPILGLGRLRERISGPLALHASTRDEPVNLSGSRPETHQHWSPAGANCCQSLLLDPNAKIDIDLRQPLFLLVNGRGE